MTGIAAATTMAVAGYLAGASLHFLVGVLGIAGEAAVGLIIPIALACWIWTRHHASAPSAD